MYLRFLDYIFQPVLILLGLYYEALCDFRREKLREEKIKLVVSQLQQEPGTQTHNVHECQQVLLDVVSSMEEKHRVIHCQQNLQEQQTLLF